MAKGKDFFTCLLIAAALTSITLNEGCSGSSSDPIDTIPPTTRGSPVGGTYRSAISVTLSADESCTIYYTIDGSDPDTSSSIYSAPICITTNTTLKFCGIDDFGNQGSVNTQAYTVDNVAPTLTASPASGIYYSAQSVTLSADPTSTIYYTTDGSEPTTSSTQYSTPINISTPGTTQLRFFCC